jgi:hypothetical protein
MQMPLHNFSVVITGQLYRCAQPDAEAFRSLRALQVTLLVKLNPETGTPAAEERYGFDVLAPDMTRWQRYLNRPNVQQLVMITDEIDRSLTDGHVLCIHCQHGRDWTGAVCAAYRVRKQHWTVTDALLEFRCFGVSTLIGLYDHEIIEAVTALAQEK